jgi:hypothetical protein
MPGTTTITSMETSASLSSKRESSGRFPDSCWRGQAQRTPLLRVSHHLEVFQNSNGFLYGLRDVVAFRVVEWGIGPRVRERDVEVDSLAVEKFLQLALFRVFAFVIDGPPLRVSCAAVPENGVRRKTTEQSIRKTESLKRKRAICILAPPSLTRDAKRILLRGGPEINP